MEKKGIPQEGLKLIACVTMLIDHIGAAIVPVMELRIIGRLAFPIYCFLLVEGVAHTRNPQKYGLRLLLLAALSELPFDLLFYGRLTWHGQSVMITLLLGFVMAMWAKKKGRILLPFAVCFFAAEFLKTDYGGTGVALIALFVVTRERKERLPLQLIGMTALMLLMGSTEIPVGHLRVPIQLFAILSMVPISLYSGRKATSAPCIQWSLNLFYPLHLTALVLLVSQFS